MESSVIIPGLKESAIKACDDFNWDTTRTLLLQSLKENSLEYQQLMSIPKDNKNLIVECCLNGYIELISVFINNNFPLNHGIRRRVSPCFNDYFSSISPWTEFSNYKTFDCMLHYAIIGRQLPLIRYLVSHGADVNIVSGLGDTPLHCIFRTHMTIEIYETPNTGYSRCTQYSKTEILKFLLEAGSNANGKSGSGNVPLHDAVFEGDIDSVQMLIDFGADPNIKNNKGYTALYIGVSAEQPMIPIIELLINSGANTNLHHQHFSVLFSALFKQNLNVIELLLERGADVNDKLYNYITPLHVFAFKDIPIRYNFEGEFASENVINIVGTLLIWGADVNITDCDGCNLLHWAAWQGSVHLVKLLIDRGLDVKDKLGKRPIHYASDAGHHNVVQYFIDYYYEISSCNIFLNLVYTQLPKGLCYY